jgi:hypothetical protein
MLTPALSSLVTRRPRLPKGSRVDRTDLVRTEFIRQRAEDDDMEGLSGWARLGITLLILFVLLWQVRRPVLNGVCGAGWVSEERCEVLRSTLVDHGPPAAPAPTAPAPAAK